MSEVVVHHSMSHTRCNFEPEHCGDGTGLTNGDFALAPTFTIHVTSAFSSCALGPVLKEPSTPHNSHMQSSRSFFSALQKVAREGHASVVKLGKSGYRPATPASASFNFHSCVMASHAAQSSYPEIRRTRPAAQQRSTESRATRLKAAGRMEQEAHKPSELQLATIRKHQKLRCGTCDLPQASFILAASSCTAFITKLTTATMTLQL